jgi:L-lysine 2,3-aminomutase
MSGHLPIGFIKKNSLTGVSKKAHGLFPFLVTEPFSSRINWENENDPLLLQVRPDKKELDKVAGFLQDPLMESQFREAPGIIKKYQGRVILQLTGACPIHCRYCFRRHNKGENIPKRPEEWQKSLGVIEADPSIREWYKKKNSWK